MSIVNDWINKPLSEIANITMGQSPDSKYYTEEESGLPFIQGCAEFTSRFPNHRINCTQIKKIAYPESILFSVRAPVGRINIADQPYIIGRGLAAISATGINQALLEKYIAYQEPFFRAASQGSTFEAINTSELSNWPIIFPSNPIEQTQIAKILTTHDQAIEQTEAIIAKQQRIKTGLMQDLLTKGIDENGNIRSEATHVFKDSPLGLIPVEWEFVQLADLTDGPESITYGVLKPGPYVDEGVPLLQIQDVIHGELEITSIHRISRELDTQYKRTRLRGGEIVVSLVGTIGRIAHLPEWISGGNLHRNLGLVRIVSPNSSRFIFHYLTSELGQRQFSQEALGSTQALFNLSALRSLKVPRPSPEEQYFIAEQCDSIQLSIMQTAALLSKLRVLKVALMHDLLTGKVRVTDINNTTLTPELL